MFSDELKYIFIHIPKTGGTSISSAISSVDPSAQMIRKHDRYIDHCKQIQSDPSEYFTFSVVRNPWDRLVSFYIWHKDGAGRELYEGDVPFREFVLNLDEYFHVTNRSIVWRDKYEDQTAWLYKKGKLIVDYLIRFEHLQEDFHRVCNQLGITKIKLPRLHQTVREHYTTYYDAQTIAAVADRYQRDLANFGYEYGQ